MNLPTTPNDEEFAALARRVRWLEDHAALTDLLNRYCRAADAGDFEAHGQCFTEDAVMITPMGEFRGRAAIEDTNRPFVLGYANLQHSMSSMVFEIDGDRATGTSSLRFTAVPRPGDAAPLLQWGGVYDFEFRRGDGQWRICWERIQSFSLSEA